jgi:hypothetical protein
MLYDLSAYREARVEPPPAPLPAEDEVLCTVTITSEGVQVWVSDQVATLPQRAWLARRINQAKDMLTWRD